MHSGCSRSSRRSRKMCATRFKTTKNSWARNGIMADPVLKFPPEQKVSPQAAPKGKSAGESRRGLMAAMRRYRRTLLLVVLPLAVLVGGVTFYLNGGRYVGTDDAYVGVPNVVS